MSSPLQSSGILPVLVADDDAAIRGLHRMLLEEAGFTVLEARDGAETLQVAFSRRIAAVVLDSHMPQMSGSEVLTALRERRETRTVPVIFVTGSSNTADTIGILEAGANDFLTKPFDGAELVARVRAHVRGQAAWMREVSEQLRERAAVTDRLGRLRPAASPAATAQAFCRELGGAIPQFSVALIGFFDGTGLPLGMQGDGVAPLESGRPLPQALAEYLRSRAARGSWTEDQLAQPAGSLGVPLFTPAVGAAAYATLRALDEPIGLLAVGRSGTPDSSTLERDLSSVIDFAAVATALLGPSLAEHGEISGRRSRLRDILRHRAYEPFFQPIVDLTDQAHVGHEVLTRFDDGTAPEQRFGEAVALGMSVEVERTTIATALRAATELPDKTWVSINVSPSLLLGAPDLHDVLASAEREIVLELTEHDPITDYPSVRLAVERLGAHVRLSVDDAGSGYACLHHVLALEPDYIKLDRRWVQGIDRDPTRQALVAGLAHFARQTGSMLIAEGIEHPSELDALTELGVALGQGYLLGRPAPIG